MLVVEGEKTATRPASSFRIMSQSRRLAARRSPARPTGQSLKGRKVAVWPDVDEPGRKYADDVAKLARKAGAAKVVVVDVPDYFRNRWLRRAGTLPTRRRPDGTSAGFGGCSTRPPTARTRMLPDFTTVLDKAAELDSVAYDRRRDELAEQLGIRKTTLDAEVEKRRQDRQEEKKALPGRAARMGAAVDGAALLDAIVDELRRYLVMPEHAPEAMALWMLHAHALDAFQCSPILALALAGETLRENDDAEASSTSSCRKACSLPTPRRPPIFRIVEKCQPTLLIDELDSICRGQRRAARHPQLGP